MSNIKVNILHYSGVINHIEIILEDYSTNKVSRINIWRSELETQFWYDYSSPTATKLLQKIKDCDAHCSIFIEQEPKYIETVWRDFQEEYEASICGFNCAFGVQWFLTRFVGIPAPDFSNISFNNFVFGCPWPSYAPSLITLPGRIFDNAKFHIDCRDNPELIEKYAKSFLNCSLGFAALAVVSSPPIAAGVAGIYLSAAISGGSVVTSLAYAASFFNLSSPKSFKAKTSPNPVFDL